MESVTPGPWTPFGLDWRMVTDADDNVIADVRTTPEDSRLIASAPDLLSVLERAIPFVAVIHREGGRPTMELAGDLLDDISAVIAKAKGRA